MSEYLIAVVGSLTGAVLLIPLGLLASKLYSDVIGEHGLIVILFNVIGLVTSWWIGTVSGCWFMLSFRHYPDVLFTATSLAILTPVGIVIFVKLINQKSINADMPGFWQLIGVITIVLAVLARLLTNWLLSLSI